MQSNNPYLSDELKIGLVGTQEANECIQGILSWLKDAVTSPLAVETKLTVNDAFHIEQGIRELADQKFCDLIFTVGGIGLSKNDVTSSAVERTLTRPLPGIAFQMRRILQYTDIESIYLTFAAGLRETPEHNTIVMTLPDNMSSALQILGGYKDDDGKLLAAGLFSTLPKALGQINGLVFNTDAEMIDHGKKPSEEPFQTLPTRDFAPSEPVMSPFASPVREERIETARKTPKEDLVARYQMSTRAIASRSVQRGVPLFPGQRVQKPIQLLDTLIKEPEDIEPTCTVIWLHGMGSNPEECVGLLDAIRQFGGPAARFIIPRAPELEMGYNNGTATTAWYKVNKDFGEKPEDVSSIKTMHLKVSQIINQIVSQGIPAETIFLGGFSQGAAMALYSGVRQARTLAGVIALSGYLPAPELLEKDITPAGKMTPYYVAHGAFDEIISPMLAKNSAQYMESKIDTLIWREYDMEHTVCSDELKHMVQFMNTALQN